MVDIVIRGGDAEKAAREMRVAIKEIFDVEPLRSAARDPLPGTRGLAEAALIVLAIPPGVVYAKKMVEDFGVGDRLRRLITRAEKESKASGARLLIDPGDGKPVPLREANQEKIREALDALEKRGKG